MTLSDIGNIVCTVFFIGFRVLLLYNIIPNNTQKKRYMEEQIQTGKDKQRMLDFMQIVMKDYYNDFTYAVGNHKIRVSKYQVNYYPYIVYFNEDKVYEKEQLARVNQLIEKLEPMLAIQELSRITGLDMIQAEKVVRRWYNYWY